MILFETVQKAHPDGPEDHFTAVRLGVALLMAGCDDTSPRTHLDWGVNTTQHTRHVASNKSGGGAKTYTYEEPGARPMPRPVPNYINRNVTPYTPITSAPLAPVAVSGNAPAFAWPVSGRVVSDFGSTTSGGKNDGINIATSLSAPIHASASGTVTYAGDELKNYGNLVLVKHSGGYATAYAHADWSCRAATLSPRGR